MSDYRFRIRNAALKLRCKCDPDFAADEIATLRRQLQHFKEENERVRQANLDVMMHFDDMKAAKEKAEAKADHCEREARQWRQEARAQSSIVAEIYQGLTGKKGEPGDWNGARPLKPAILRKQAEAVEEIVDADPDGRSEDGSALISVNEIWDYAQSLRQQADEAERAGGEK